MGYNKQTREWLINGISHYEQYGYGYIFTFQDRKVIATANGYIACYSWDIPDESQEEMHDHDGIQIVDFGIGENLAAAKGWKTVVPAFTNILDRFSICDPIEVECAPVIEAINRFDRYGEHGFDEDGVSIHLKYSMHLLHMTCSDEGTVYNIPVKAPLHDEERLITVNARFLKNAVSGFMGNDTIVFRILMKPDVVAIGTEGDKVGIIMGILTQSNE